MAENFRTQVKNLRPALLASRSGLPTNPSQWKGDGVDHINIMANGTTLLGRSLSIRNFRDFDHPVLGNFRSLNNLWFFIRAAAPDDTMRDIQEHERLRNYVAANGGERNNVKNFQACFMHSAYLRLLSMPSTINEVIKSTLPFDSYRKTVTSVIMQRLFYSEWVAKGYEEIRKALKERREPDFTYLMEGKKPAMASDIYKDVIEAITGMPSTEPLDFTSWIADRWEKYDAYVRRQEITERRKAKEARAKAKAATATGVVVHAIDTPADKQDMPAVPVVESQESEEPCGECLNCACESETQALVETTEVQVAEPEVAEAQAAAPEVKPAVVIEEAHEDIVASQDEMITVA